MTYPTDAPTDQAEDHRLFVKLPVKADQFDAYLDAMRAEAAGARSEKGNHGFDVFGDADDPHTMYLLEHWASEEALLRDHANQLYYIQVRGMEEQSLAGGVEERLLREINAPSQHPTAEKKTVGGRHARAHILIAYGDAADKLESAFSQTAGLFREAEGNCTWTLFQNRREPEEYLLFESWDIATLREHAWSNEAAAPIIAAVEYAGSGGTPIVLTNLDDASTDDPSVT